MTEYEMLDASISYSSNAMNAMTLYFSAVTAYLVAAFMAGDRLDRTQIVVVNTLFIFVSAFFTYGTVGYLYRQLILVEKMRALSPQETFLIEPKQIIFIAAVMTLGILASIYFMWKVRH